MDDREYKATNELGSVMRKDGRGPEWWAYVFLVVMFYLLYPKFGFGVIGAIIWLGIPILLLIVCEWLQKALRSNWVGYAFIVISAILVRSFVQ